MKRVLIIILAFVALVASLFYFFVYPKFIIISGYAAKNMCSCVFVGGIDEEKAKNEDLNFNIISLANIDVDYTNKFVTASVFGLNSKTAYFQGPTGCTMINNINHEDAYRYSEPWEIVKYDSMINWFEYIDTIEYLSDNNQHKLKQVLSSAFEEADPAISLKNTRAALVLYKGQLVAEQYAEGFNKNSRLMGWSMTKSLTATMLAMLADEGKIDINAKTGIPSWQHDARKEITWKQLLHMNSGLAWDEVYDTVSDAVLMLFNSDAIGEFAMNMPLEYQPDSHWEYSSGTSNIIATNLSGLFNTTDEYVRYPYESLFYKIGAYSMVIETDAVGSFVGSSYSWATTRDWAKIGQLYLQKGNWAGEQILDKDWVKFVQQPAPNSDGIYGGHFWLNKGGRYPDAPEDLYSLDGFQGQMVFIIPSKELVIVRMGLTYNEKDFDFNQWLKNIIDAIEN